MNCPNQEKLIAFAVDPLHEKHAELAGHISVCPQCRKRLADFNRSVLLSDEKVTEEDVKLVKSFIREWKKEGSAEQWALLRARVETLWSRASKEPSFPAAFILPESMFGVCAASSFAAQLLTGVAGMVAGAAKKDSDQDAVCIGFIADCSRTSPYYWKAEMLIPQEATADSILAVFLTDSKGQEIKEGVFTLVGIPLELDDGIAGICFREFRENLKNTAVSMRYPDGTDVSGTLAPWKYGC